MQTLLKACRANDIPVVHVITAYQITDRDNSNTDMGQWHHKISVEAENIKKEHLWTIDSCIAFIIGECVMMKKWALSFSGTPLAGYLRGLGVDIILVTRVTATAYVRTPICDGLTEGFPTIVVKEAIGDRVPGAVAWNLFDIDAKFADFETTDTCVSYLDTVNRRNDD